MNFIRYHRWPAHVAARADGAQAFDRRHARHADEAAQARWVPRVDIREEDARFVIEADLPGIDPQAIEIQMEQGALSIQGERAAAATDAAQFSRRERRTGAFHRRFLLPDSADAQGISASGRDGVLEIVIPKKAETAPRKIRVTTTDGTATVQ